MPLLGQKAADFSEDLIQRLTKRRISVFPAVVEPKINGLRTIITLRHRQRPVISSFAGNIVTSMPEVADQLEEFMWSDHPHSERIVLDGESFIPGVSFEESSGAFRTKNNVPRGLQFHLFDVQVGQMMGRDRRGLIEYIYSNVLKSIGPKRRMIELVPYEQAADIDEVRRLYDKYLEQGWEGAMVKLPQQTYHYTRHWSWMKLKEVRTCEAVVTGAVEGTGKYVGMLGALECLTVTGPNQSGKGESGGVPVSIGTGFTDSDREGLWKRHMVGELKGQILEMSYQMATKYGNMRHPRFERWRPGEVYHTMHH